MRLALALTALTLCAPALAKPELRCGWLDNPTPGNWWLTDREGEWELGLQGGYQAPGLDRMPDMRARGWRETNGRYGYGCACMRVDVDARDRRVTRLYAALPKPLRQCEADRKLPQKQLETE